MDDDVEAATQRKYSADEDSGNDLHCTFSDEEQIHCAEVVVFDEGRIRFFVAAEEQTHFERIRFYSLMMELSMTSSEDWVHLVHKLVLAEYPVPVFDYCSTKLIANGSLDAEATSR